MAERYPPTGRFVDWAAVVAGFVVAFVTFILLSLLAAIGGGATIGWLIAVISFLALLTGGWTAGYLAPANGLLHGTLVAVVVITAMVLISAMAAAGLAGLAGISVSATAAAIFVDFIIQLIGGAVGGYLGGMSARAPAVRT